MNSKDFIEVWNETTFNPSSRHQTKADINLGKFITQLVEKEVF